MKKLSDEEIDSIYNKGCFVMMEKGLSIKIARDCGLQCVALYNMILMHKYNDRWHGCYPTYETLMQECCISSKTTLLSYLSKLEQHGYIKIKSGNKNSSNTYYFPLASDKITNYTDGDYDYIYNIHRKKGNKNVTYNEKSSKNLKRNGNNDFPF